MLRSNILVASCSAPAPSHYHSAACGKDTAAATSSNKKERRILGSLQWSLGIRLRCLADTGHKLCCRWVWVDGWVGGWVREEGRRPTGGAACHEGVRAGTGPREGRYMWGER